MKSKGVWSESRNRVRRTVLAHVVGSLGVAGLVSAAEITWTPGNGNWNDSANWNPAAVPTISDVAVFGAGAVTSVNVSGGAYVETVRFDAGASAYGISVGADFYVVAGGIVNNSAVTQYITLDGVDTVLSFQGVASTGDNTHYTVNATTSLQVIYSVMGASTVQVNAGGFLQFVNASSADSARIVMNGGSLIGFTDGGVSIGSLEGTGEVLFSSLNGGTASQTLTIGALNTDTTFSGSIGSDPANAVEVSLVKTGTGTLTLTGSSVISGYLTLDGGTLAIAGAGASLDLGTVGGVSVGSGGDAELVVSGGAELKGRDADIGMGGVGTVTITGADSVWEGNYISVGRISEGNLNVLDGGAVMGQRGYVGASATGMAIIDGEGSLWSNPAGLLVGFGAGGNGTVSVKNGGLVRASLVEMGNGGSSGAIMVQGSEADGRGVIETGGFLKQGGTATIDVDGGVIRATGASATFITGFGAGEVTLGAGGLFLDSAGFNIGTSVSIDGAGSLVKQGSGALTLTGASAYTGGTTIEEGRILVGNNAALGTGTVTLADGAALGTSTGSRTLANNLVIDGDATFAPTGALSTLAFTGAVNLNGAGRTLTFVSSSLNGVDFRGVISNDDGQGLVLQRSGTGVTFVTFEGAAANTYTGATVVGDGISLFLEKTAGITAIRGDLEVGNGAMVTVGFNEQIDNAARVDVDGTGILQIGSGAGRTETIGSLYGDGEVRLNAASASSTLIVSEGVFSGSLSDGSAMLGKLVKTGSGTLVLSGELDFGGALTLQGGVLAVDSVSEFTVGSVSFEGGALLAEETFTTNVVINVGPGGGRLMAASGAVFTLTRATLNQLSGTQSLNFGDALHTGTVVISGNSQAAGAATLDGGTLLVNGSLASASFSVAGEATLGGTGSIAGDVTVADGGRLAPGASPGTLTFGSLVLNDASLLDYELGSPAGVAGVDSDLISVTGDLTLDGVLNLITAPDFGEGTYQLFGYGGALTDNQLGLGLAPAGYNLEIDFSTPNQVNLVADYTGLQFWDGAQTSADNAVQGGAGVWDTSATNWTNATGSANNAWADLTAVFSGAAGGTVDVADDVMVAGLQFATDGYVLADAGGSIEFTDAETEIRVGAAVDAEIGAVITGAGGLVKTGGGRLVLSGANTYAGDTAINAGVLEVSADTNLGGAAGDVVFNGGTLRATASFTSARDFAFAASAGVSVGAGTTLTHTGGVSGSGTLTKTGAGNLALTGDSDAGFTGELHVNDGRVLVAAGGRLFVSGAGVGVADGSTAELVVTGGASVLDANDFFVVGAGTGATGSLTIQNGGVVSLGSGAALVVGADDASGVLTLGAGGVLEVGGAGGLSASATAVSSQVDLAGGTLRVINSDLVSAVDLTLVAATDSAVDTAGLNAVLSGKISGDGALTKTGTGTLRLTGSNTYNGGTTVTDGTLVADVESLPGDVTNDAALVFAQTTDGTYAGVVSGTGSLTKTGAGALVLADANTYTGATLVDGGSLIVNGSLARTAVTVDSGALLGGSGAIGGAVTVRDGGYFSPGDGVGVINVGSLTLRSGSTTRMQISGTNTAGVDYDHIRVNGTATLGGTLELITGAYVPRDGDEFVLIDADAITLGSDFAAVNGLGNALTFSATITDDYTLRVTAAQTDYAAFALTSNQRAVAENIDSDWRNPALDDVVDSLNSLPGALLPAAFDLIAPEEYALLPNVAKQNTRAQWAALRRRLGEVRAGATGWSTSGLGHTERTAPLLAAMGGTADALALGALADGTATEASPRRGFFVSAAGAFGETEAGENPGFEFSSGSFLVGADANLTPDFAVGVAAGYDTTNADPDSGGSINTDTARVAIYGSWTSVDGVWVNATTGGAYHWHDARRDALGGTASASPESVEFNSLIETGVDLTRGAWTLTPSVGVDYVRVRTDEFVESGSLAPLAVEAGASDSLRSELALTLSRRFVRDASIWDGWVRAGWAHEFLDTRDTVRSRFASGAGGDFTVHGNRVERDALVLATGVRATWNETTVFSLGYSGDYSADYRVHSLTASVRLGF